MAISFDLFGTLVTAERPDNPAKRVGTALAEEGVPVPDNWSELYWQLHLSPPEGAEIPLDEHIVAALDSQGITVERDCVRTVIERVFEPTVRTRDGAVDAVQWAADQGPTAICSNCAVPGLVDRALQRSAIDERQFDAIIASAACGWRKPHARIFEHTAQELAVPVEQLVHVGDTPDADGGIDALGGQAVLLDTHDIRDLPSILTAE